MPIDIEIDMGGPRQTPAQVFRAWTIGGGIVGAAIVLVVLAVALALIVIPAAAVGAFAGSLVGALLGVFKAATALFKRD